MFALSRSEKEFLVSGVEGDCRADGRSRLDYRPIHLETDVVLTAHGSARVLLDQTHIVIGVKLEINPPEHDTPNQGSIVCSVECSAIASDRFRGQGALDPNTELTGAIQRFYNQSVDLEALCIVPGRLCWTVFIDAEILDTDGSAIDAISMGVRAALKTAQIPTIHLIGAQDRTSDIDFEVAPDPLDSTRLLTDKTPICTCLSKIGRCFVADATVQEELCMSAQMAVAVNVDGEICGIMKLGMGSLTPSDVVDSLAYATAVGSKLIKRVDELVADNVSKINNSMSDL